MGASIDVMKRDAALMRGEGPTVMGSVKHGDGVDDIIQNIEMAIKDAGVSISAVGGGKSKN